MIDWLKQLGRAEKLFFLLVLADIALFAIRGSAALGLIITVAAILSGIIVMVRLVRNVNRTIWRLRSRLILSYLFVAVVPLALIVAMVAIAGYVMVGQVAIYAVNRELERRIAELPDPEAPSPEFLSNLAPSIGDVFVVERSKASLRFLFGGHGAPHAPPASNVFDIEVIWQSPIELGSRSYELFVVSRPSAVLTTIFLQKLEWSEEILWLSGVVGALFFLVLLSAVVVGISITRNITGAVHDLYEGTQKIKEGDFTHRIPVHGKDQLAELSLSFNSMTENVERLIKVEKEEQRLSSELEIAREVQRQLFPKAALKLHSFELTGVCHPAQVVSGDYYDYFPLEGSSLAMAIGDVAGKGISAALLMATIQSAVRSELTTSSSMSTARIVGLLNKQIFASTSPEKYASFYFGLYDESTGAFTYTNAGHPPPLLFHDGVLQKLDATGTVVGAFPGSSYEERQVTLGGGDMLVAYTDGITEPEDAYGEMFGEERLIDTLLKYKDADAGEIIARAMEAVVHWTGSPELQDDMTMLVARRTVR